jgi:predicted RNA-binding Zn ribbon-like protein
MNETATRAETLKLVGGRLCLDFANTIDGRNDVGAVEYLHDYDDLLAWGRHSGALSDDAARRLSGEAARRPDEARAAFMRALALREALYRIFSLVAQDATPASDDLALLNAMLSEAMGRAQLIPTDRRFSWEWREDDLTLDRVLWPVVRSAVELLTAPELRRVRECPGANCDWLFVDSSKNRSRRWCTMETCGNRAKARRHYARSRTGE